MASQGYREWLAEGCPYTLIRPARAVQATLRGHGLTVYDYPNEEHQKANTPEDHTPYSVTGWPGTNKRWKARALDIMPRKGVPAAQAAKENADIARQLIKDRDAGHPGVMWIKYINWTDEKGNCQQERWTDAANPLRRTTRASSDDDHIHISGRSDADDDDRADGYDSISRMNGADDDMTPEQAATLARMDGRMAALYYGMEGNPYGAGTMKGEANQVGLALRRLEAAAAADEARDKAALAALNTIIAAFNAAGGGSLDEARVIAAVRAVGDQVHADVLQLQQLLTESRGRELALQQQLAAVRAATEAQLSQAERASLPAV